MDKIEDFGVHAAQYYSLKVEIYKTKTDEKLLELLWNKYWVATLSSSLILSVSHTLIRSGVKLIDIESIIRNRPSGRPQSQDQSGIANPWTSNRRPFEGGRDLPR
jgi:hypothetical protein